VDRPPFRLEFAIPEGTDVQEPPPPGKSVFHGEVVRNALLERLRAELGKDTRWSLRRVEPLLPEGPQQHIVVWVDPASDVGDEEVPSGVHDVVADVIANATLVGSQRTGL
jgi:hypothetical protein